MMHQILHQPKNWRMKMVDIFERSSDLCDEVDGINPPVGEPRGQKSRVFGMWVADVKNAWGDRSKFPVIANSRDLQLFKKVLQYDTLYTWSELHEKWSGSASQKAVERSYVNVS